MTSLAISGHRESGQDVRTANVTACVAVANILRSSLGPQGLDKMLVDEVGDVTVTNDGATIVGLLEVEHPAARILTELAQQQDQEVGDGTTSVVILAAELLKRANDLVTDKIHPTNIIAGYRLAIREACKYVRDHMVRWGVHAGGFEGDGAPRGGRHPCVSLVPFFARSTGALRLLWHWANDVRH